ncbi:MAG TPA: dihydroorotate dehydrogenase electron transfer subunit [Bacteroidota bacterium]
MMIELCPVEGVRTVGEGIHVLSFTSAAMSRSIRAGQFLNLRVEEGCEPLLRRPFSAYRIEKTSIDIVFHVVGRGTAALRRKREGDLLDVLGPLGKPFNIDDPGYDTGVLIGGGLGVAPFPLLTSALKEMGKPVLTFLGARSAGQLVTDHLENLHTATDDGSKGFRGNAVDLASDFLRKNPVRRPKIFACGPMPMLRAVASLARASDIPCEVSLEGPMGCGIGICQGCPVELAGPERLYALMCKDGPAFDIRTIKI